MKKAISILLVLILVIGIAPAAFATGDTTSLGDAWLHEYLMNLNPDTVELGPTRTGAFNGKDYYLFDSQLLDYQICSDVESHYRCAKYSDVTIPAQWDFVGTRVITSLIKGDDKLISISIFTADHQCRNIQYRITCYSDADLNAATAFGDNDLHRMLLEFNPNQVYLGPTRDTQYSHFDMYYYSNQYLAGDICMMVECMYPEAEIDVYEVAVAQAQIRGTRVETSAQFGDIVPCISVETFREDGSFIAVRYWFK